VILSRKGTGPSLPRCVCFGMPGDLG
jgi:hypothetical protein